MPFLRQHWFDIGIFLAAIILACLCFAPSPFYSLHSLLWLNLVTLFLHQFEEYRFPGYFPGMLNAVIYRSSQPDRFPLNTNTALIINVALGWPVYTLAALLAQQAVWLGIGAIIISAGNFIVHTFVFNIRGRPLYNPGQLTAMLLFLPMVLYFFYFIAQYHMATPADYIIGIGLGVVLNVAGILKPIDWLRDEKTRYIFKDRQLRPVDRRQGNRLVTK